jgi:hypothetical protein
MHSNTIHGPSTQNMWRITRKVLETDLVLTIARDSDFSLTWDWLHWKVYLLNFSCICRKYKSEIGCVLYFNFKARWSWTPNWTWSQTLEFRIGCSCWYSMPLKLSPTSSTSSPWFLRIIISLGNNIFSKPINCYLKWARLHIQLSCLSKIHWNLHVN